MQRVQLVLVLALLREQSFNALKQGIHHCQPLRVDALRIKRLAWLTSFCRAISSKRPSTG